MEMGTMEDALLRDHGPQMEAAVTVATDLSGTGVWFRSVVASCLSCRSGDAVADGGHIIVLSIWQDMSFMSAASCTFSLTIGRSGNTHMVPVIWQKANNNTKTTSRMLVRGII